MKFLLIGDVHIDKYQYLIDEKINVLKSYLDNDIKNVIIPGDIFELHKGGTTYAVEQLQELFSNSNKKFYLIIGNHDTYFKNKIKPNSIETSFKNIKNCIIIDKPTEIDDILMIPWICSENYELCIDTIKKSKMNYCVGHFSINSFLMNAGIECRSSLKMSDFDHFKKVISSHFHLRQEKKNVLYLGSITQDSWSDYNNQKGYHILDTTKNDIKFVEGPDQIYKHLTLENNKCKFELDDYNDCHVKLYHKEKLSKKQFDNWDLLKYNLRSYQVFDETDIEIKEVKIEKVEFTDVLDEFFDDQEMEDKFKTNVKQYLIMKHKEIG